MSQLHAHLVFVTKYRRKLFTDAMLTDTEHTMRAVCADLAVHLLVTYPPTLAISVVAQRLKGRTAYAVRREFTGRMCPCPHAWPPVVAVLLRRLLRRCAAVHHQATHRRNGSTHTSTSSRPNWP